MGERQAWLAHNHITAAMRLSALSGDGARQYRLGGRFETGLFFDLSIEGARREDSSGEAEHSIRLNGRLRF